MKQLGDDFCQSQTPRKKISNGFYKTNILLKPAFGLVRCQTRICVVLWTEEICRLGSCGCSDRIAVATAIRTTPDNCAILLKSLPSLLPRAVSFYLGAFLAGSENWRFQASSIPPVNFAKAPKIVAQIERETARPCSQSP